jgi:hypothetical protein
MSPIMRSLRTPSSAPRTSFGLMPIAVIVAMAAALRRTSRRLIESLVIVNLPGLMRVFAVFLLVRRSFVGA